MHHRRAVLLTLVAGMVVGAGIAAGIAEASSSPASGSSSSGAGGGSVATATVQRTTLASTVQVGGSIGYQGSYTIVAPSGASPQQIAQDQQAITQAEQSLAADQTTEADATTADDQAAFTAQDNLNTATAALDADQAQETKDCAGQGSSTPACAQDAQNVSQDQSQYTQAQQSLAMAKETVARDHDQNGAKVTADGTQLQAAQANLAALEAMAVNPGTTYTELPTVGQIIREDQPLYSVSNEPVPLLYGPVAAYRAFQVGMSPGADVGQLTKDLIALGYGAGLTQTNSYTAATAAGVEHWQTALGLPATGTVLLGQAVFEPGPIRVTTVTPAVGQAVGGGGSSGSAGGGTVLIATSTRPIVTIALEVTEEYLVKPGDTVTVVLPDGTTTVDGRVQTVGDVATCPNGSGSGAGSGPADESPCASSGSGSNNTPTVTVTISLDATPPGATLDQAPVNVNITTQRADNVLAVPVNALLALQDGGYGVDVVEGGTTAPRRRYHRPLQQHPGRGQRGRPHRGDQGRGSIVMTLADQATSEPAGASAPVVELLDVFKEYPGDPPVAALAGVSLRIDAGELVAIVGPSGSGKTTLLHIMGSLERPTRGVVRIAGEDTSTMSDKQLSGLRARQLGFVFQQFFLLDGLSVLDNVADGLLYRGGRLSERRQLATVAIERVGLAPRMTHRPNQLSGGEQQRTAIARALAGRPALVMADEPTGNLDSVTGTAILDLIRELHDEGTTIVVITHDHDVAAAMDRRIEIRDGKVLSDRAT